MTEKQVEILDAAEELFCKQGFDGTSVRDIAHRANANVAMISYYFGSKEKLLETLFEVRIEQLKMDVDIVDDTRVPVLKKLDVIIERYVKAMNNNAQLYQILAVEASIKRKMLVSPEFSKLKKFNLGIITQIMKEGLRQGVFKPRNPVLVHATMMGTFMNIQMNKIFLKESLNIDSDEDYSLFIESELIEHMQITIKSLLIYDN